MKALAQAVIGLVLIFVVHLPRLLFHGLLVSYAAVFENTPTLTASVDQHLARAKSILRRGRLSEILYAAVELRFAVERMVQRELVFAEMASKRMHKDYDPVKKIANLRRLAPDSEYEHEIYVVNRVTGERISWARYKPLDKARVADIKGRLGDLLHPKEGLHLGIPNDPWYQSSVRFLHESLAYLEEVHADNQPFFAYQGLDQFEMIRVE